MVKNKDGSNENNLPDARTGAGMTINDLPKIRGRYSENAPLGEKGWFRCGGTADILFKPADEDDLQYFLQNYSPPKSPPQAGGSLFVAPPSAEGELSVALPKAEGSLSVAPPPAKGELSVALPKAEGSLFVALPLAKGELSVTLPKAEGSLSVAPPPAKGESSVTLPKAEGSLSVTPPFAGGIGGEVHIFGALSNCIIRDGGVRGVVIRLGREFSSITVEGTYVTAGALALDANVAKIAAENGIAGLEFFSGIPGSVGGALRMNAGCYGVETKDVLVECKAMDRQGNIHILRPANVSSLHQQGSGDAEQDPDFRRDDGVVREKMHMTYRHVDVPEDYIFLTATFEGQKDDPEIVKARMADIKKNREDSQPIREKTGGSTFANPDAAELSQAGLSEDTKVWQLIDQAGGRGLKIGGAQMSEKHCNFMINTGNASAADLEALGEEIKRRVAREHGITLRWEIRRIGEV